MKTRTEVFQCMTRLDRMRGGAESMRRRGDPLGPLSVRVCDAGNAMCRAYLAFHRAAEADFGSSAVRRQYHDEVEPLEREYAALAAMLGERIELLFEGGG